MAAGIRRLLKVIQFNAKDICELSKQLKELHINVTVLLETDLKPHEGPLFQSIIFIGPTASGAERAELPL
jgi:hypothetical protein